MRGFDLIHEYLFENVSTAHRTDLGQQCGCCSMIEEMNRIRASFRNGAPFTDVIRQCVCNRRGHQYCVPEEAVNKAVNQLVGSLQVTNGNSISNTFADFEELYDWVYAQIGHISGIGQLTVYDTARRLGHLLTPPVYPEQYVYLAAGAKEGAEDLLKQKDLKFRERVQRFTPYFGTLPSIFIEDILCIYKNRVGNLTSY